MKLSGTDSCISIALTKTKSPTVCVPATTSRADSHMTMVMPRPKITPWPKFSQPSEVQVLVAALLVARHRAVEALGLHRLVVEILDRLVVQQRVDRLGVGVGVAVVHLAADGDAPVARPDGEPDVEPHGDRDRRRHRASHRRRRRCRRQREFEDRRRRVQHGEADDRLDALGAALDDARQAAGAPLEMEAQRQLVHVHEGAVGELAHRILADAGEQRVAQLVEAGLQQRARHCRRRPASPAPA